MGIDVLCHDKVVGAASRKLHIAFQGQKVSEVSLKDSCCLGYLRKFSWRLVHLAHFTLVLILPASF